MPCPDVDIVHTVTSSDNNNSEVGGEHEGTSCSPCSDLKSVKSSEKKYIFFQNVNKIMFPKLL